jgi:hypothetical protein
MSGAANNPTKAQAPPTRLGRVFRSGWFWLLVSVLIWVTAGVVHFKGPRTCVYGWLRMEPTYRGLPASFWRAVLQDPYTGPPFRRTPPTDIIDLLQYRAEQFIAYYLTLHSFARWLDPNDPRLRAVTMHLLSDDDPTVRMTANYFLASQVEHYPELFPIVAKSLESKLYMERLVAIQAMRHLGPRAKIALPKLKEVFNCQHRDMEKIEIASAILQVDPGDQEAREYLFSLTRPGPDGVRDDKLAHMALLNLSYLESPISERMPEILELARDGNSDIASAAQRILIRWDPALARQEREKQPGRKSDE